jgi:hypothetical protein
MIRLATATALLCAALVADKQQACVSRARERVESQAVAEVLHVGHVR